MKKNLIHHFFVSFFLIFIWVILARNYYGYNHDFPVALGINLLPLIAGTLGLFVVYIIYYNFIKLVKIKNILAKFLIFSLISVVVLLALETFGYHILSIKNNYIVYPGLPICNCIHAPGWMQAIYLLMAPFYFIICVLLKLENNNKKYAG